MGRTLGTGNSLGSLVIDILQWAVTCISGSRNCHQWKSFSIAWLSLLKLLSAWSIGLWKPNHTSLVSEKNCWSTDCSRSEFVLILWSALKRNIDRFAWFHFDPSHKCFYWQHVSDYPLYWWRMYYGRCMCELSKLMTLKGEFIILHSAMELSINFSTSKFNS